MRKLKWVVGFFSIFILSQVLVVKHAKAFGCGMACMAPMNQNMMGSAFGPYNGLPLFPAAQPTMIGQMPLYNSANLYNGWYSPMSYPMPMYYGSPAPMMRGWGAF